MCVVILSLNVYSKNVMQLPLLLTKSWRKSTAQQLEHYLLALQNFIDMLLQHEELCHDDNVFTFFCPTGNAGSLTTIFRNVLQLFSRPFPPSFSPYEKKTSFAHPWGPHRHSIQPHTIKIPGFSLF